MRLPMIGAKGPMDGFNPDIPIDEVEATKMIHHALEQGINYFDTAYGYHGGKSEVFVGKGSPGTPLEGDDRHEAAGVEYRKAGRHGKDFQ